MLYGKISRTNFGLGTLRKGKHLGELGFDGRM